MYKIIKMKTTILLLIACVLFVGCHKKEKSEAIATNGLSGTSWVYAYDSCRGLNFTKDSAFTTTCNYAPDRMTYKLLSNDTFLVSNNKYIIKVKGDTLFWVPAPYDIWSSKYIRR